jgi:hypothetical protein
MNQLSDTIIICPYCGEQLEVLIDNSAGDQEYIEDCQVCCSPIELSVQIDASGLITSIQTKRDSD